MRPVLKQKHLGALAAQPKRCGEAPISHLLDRVSRGACRLRSGPACQAGTSAALRGCGGVRAPLVSYLPLAGRSGGPQGPGTSGGVARSPLSQQAAAEARRVSAVGRIASAALLDNRTEDENASAGGRLLDSSRRSNHTAGPRSTQTEDQLVRAVASGPPRAGRRVTAHQFQPVAAGRGFPQMAARALRSCLRQRAAQAARRSRLDLDGEFDPGSGRTLAARFIHASRTSPGLRSQWESGERVSNT